MEGVQAHPLAWPVGRPRATHRKTAQFGKNKDTGNGYSAKRELTIADARERLQRELDLLGAKQIVLSSNVELRLDGQPRSGQPEPNDPGVALYFFLKGKQTTLACDLFNRVPDNMAAIALHIEALRGIERWGVGTLDQAFAGFQMLPPPEQWWQILKTHEIADDSTIKAAHRALISSAEVRGNDSLMARINAARDEGLKANGY